MYAHYKLITGPRPAECLMFDALESAKKTQRALRERHAGRYPIEQWDANTDLWVPLADERQGS